MHNQCTPFGRAQAVETARGSSFGPQSIAGFDVDADKHTMAYVKDGYNKNSRLPAPRGAQTGGLSRQSLPSAIFLRTPDPGK